MYRKFTQFYKSTRRKTNETLLPEEQHQIKNSLINYHLSLRRHNNVIKREKLFHRKVPITTISSPFFHVDGNNGKFYDVKLSGCGGIQWSRT